jgi:hypothetical protein
MSVPGKVGLREQVQAPEATIPPPPPPNSWRTGALAKRTSSPAVPRRRSSTIYDSDA